jgi:hypothetical protein
VRTSTATAAATTANATTILTVIRRCHQLNTFTENRMDNELVESANRMTVDSEVALAHGNGY